SDQLVITPKAVNFPTSAVPGPVTLQVAPTANSSGAVPLTVTEHAWLDESTAVAQLFNNENVELYTVAVDPQSGKALIGGHARSPGSHPVAAIYTPGVGWQKALDGFNTSEGSITSAAPGPNGEFLIAGITGTKDAYLNASLLQIHCSAS